MNYYEEQQAAKDARLLAQPSMPIYQAQRRKGIRHRITVAEIVAANEAAGVIGGLSETTIERIESGQLQVEHRFKPQPVQKRYSRSKQELLLQFQKHQSPT